MLAKSLLVLAVLLALAVALVVGGLRSNRAPLGDPPGPAERLRIYLGSNVAETGPRARLPELAPVLLAGEPGEALLAAVAAACESLGWRVVDVDVAGARLHAEVVTPLLRFTDDVHVRLLARAEGGTEARVRSASRVGRGDLGANARHVMDLRAALARAGLVASDVR